jgi:LemA protein
MQSYKNYIIWGIVILFVISMFGYSCNSYNGMVNRQEDVSKQWAQVQNVYQRRADLIPNLVNVVKGYAAHEKTTLTDVVNARAKATSVNIDASKLNESNLKQFQQAQDQFSSAISRLMVVVEKYPDLKANQNFLELQSQLEGTENRITVERQKFNESAKSYNVFIRIFPKNIFAGMFGFDKKAYFESMAGADKAPTVQF